MRLLDENDNEISESDCDLSIGYIQQEIVVRADATPIDDETKLRGATMTTRPLGAIS